jgi:CheY-like chemotaxis protein
MKPSEIEVLLVEDSSTDAELIMLAFKKNNLTNKVLVVTDGQEALDCIFARGAYQDQNIKQGLRVILLDLNLPRVSGLNVLAALKSDPTTRTIPVVVLTSSQLDTDIAECYRLGANSYIVKPVDYDNFIKYLGYIGFYWFKMNQLTPLRKAT